jgi:hypothetical protein
MEAFADMACANPLFARYLAQGPEAERFIRSCLMTHRGHGIAHTAREVLARRPTLYSLEARLRELRVPTLLIVGEDDVVSPPPEMEEMAGQIANSRLVKLPRAGHLSNLEAPEAFNAALTEASAGVLGQLALVGERADFPLRRLSAQRYVAPRVALVGDAAHVIHPLAGQGVNQGFEDAACLAAQLARRPPRESIGALVALRRYERERRAGNALVGGVVDSLDRLFTTSGPVAWVAREGMALVARSALARRFLVRQAAGRLSRSRGQDYRSG